MLYFLERKIKRGLVNGLGSVFKAITGNLDGERFESLVSELQNNQNKILEAINSQNTLSVELLVISIKPYMHIAHNQLSSLRSVVTQFTEEWYIFFTFQLFIPLSLLSFICNTNFP
nr:unnamed protein product [Callosobruchus analis]